MRADRVSDETSAELRPGRLRLGDRLMAAFESEPLDDGMDHPAERVIAAALDSEDADAVLRRIRSMCRGRGGTIQEAGRTCSVQGSLKSPQAPQTVIRAPSRSRSSRKTLSAQLLPGRRSKTTR